MKKSKNILFIILIALLLISCSPKEAKVDVKIKATTTQKGTDDLGDLNTEIIFLSDSSKDRVLEQKTTNHVVFVKNPNKDRINELKKGLEQSKKIYTSTKGLKYTAEMNDKEAREIFELDYKNADFKELKKLELITNKNDKEITHISLKESIEGLKKDGFKLEIIEDNRKDKSKNLLK